MNKNRKMGRTRSRTSRTTLGASTMDDDGNRFEGVPPMDIPLSKWQGIREEEDIDYIINSIREEIIQIAMDKIYAKYLERTVYSFVVHCSYLAWIQFFNSMDLKYDPGESPASVAEFWSGDTEPSTVPTDPWTCRKVPVLRKEPPPPEPKPCLAPCASGTDTGEPVIENLFVFPFENPQEVVPTVSAPPRKPEGQTENVPSVSKHRLREMAAKMKKPTTSADDVIKTELEAHDSRSIFTRTISMTKEDLPMPRWPPEQLALSSVASHSKAPRLLMETVVPPRMLDFDKLPEERLDVKYAIVAEHIGAAGSAKLDPEGRGKKKPMPNQFMPKRQSKPS